MASSSLDGIRLESEGLIGYPAEQGKGAVMTTEYRCDNCGYRLQIADAVPRVDNSCAYCGRDLHVMMLDDDVVTAEAIPIDDPLASDEALLQAQWRVSGLLEKLSRVERQSHSSGAWRAGVEFRKSCLGAVESMRLCAASIIQVMPFREVGTLVIATEIGAAVGACSVIASTTALSPILIGALIGAAIGLAFFAPIVFLARMQSVGPRIERLLGQIKEDAHKRAAWQTRKDEIRQQLIDARMHLRSIEERNYRYRLINTDWRSLRGLEFEEFLANVFRLRGWAAELTKASNDQGADLIVNTGRERIAIQVKGYAGRVGGDAVKEAHTGKDVYGCHRAVAITNSTFTRQAQDLAAKLGCRLIDGRDLPALIAGHTPL